MQRKMSLTRRICGAEFRSAKFFLMVLLRCAIKIAGSPNLIFIDLPLYPDKETEKNLKIHGKKQRFTCRIDRKCVKWGRTESALWKIRRAKEKNQRSMFWREKNL